MKRVDNMRQLLTNNKLRATFLSFLVMMLSSLLSVCSPIVKSATVEDRIDHFIYQEPKPEKVVYLTFDDGPSAHTLDLLNLLEQEQVPAVFFVIGENINNVPNSGEILKEILNKGHYIGLHSMTHDLDKLYNAPDAATNFVNEMLEVRGKVKELTGFESNLCRPPYGGRGHFTNSHYQAIKEAGLSCVDWNVDSLDWAKSSSEEIVNQVKKDLEIADYPNEVVLLFHEKKLTLETLPQVFKYYRDLGYVFMPYYDGDEFECELK